MPPVAPSTALHKAQVYLRSASVLLELEDHDSSVSRSYFAMSFAALALLDQRGVDWNGGSGLRQAFLEHFVADGPLPPHVGEAFREAAKLQEAADYSPRFAASAGQAERVLQQAEVLVTAAARLLERG